MIRIRNETGVRSRGDILAHTLAPPDWVRLAVFCASLQARSLIESGKKKIRSSSVKETEPEFNLLYFYEVGLVELIAWDEHDRTRKLLKIRSADLSLRAAQSLISVGLLPRCFLPVLMSEDLIENESPRMITPDELVAEEFAAWIECGGLNEDRYTMQQISNSLKVSIETDIKYSTHRFSHANTEDRLRSQQVAGRTLAARALKTLGVCAKGLSR